MSTDNIIRSTPENEENKKTRRAFLKGAAASFGGLVIAPLSYARAGNNTGFFTAEIESITSNMLGAGIALTSSALSSALGACSAAPVFVGDINRDCEVDIDDLRLMARDWLSHSANPLCNLDSAYSYIPGSANSYVYVDFGDFRILAKDWGKSDFPDSASSLI